MSALDGPRIALGARAPFSGAALLGFLGARAIPGVEVVDERAYVRWARFGADVGRVEVALDGSAGVVVSMDTALAGHVEAVVARARALCDLDAPGDVIAAHLGEDPLLGPLVARWPGLRVPGVFDPWEVGARTILGQQVSVRAASTVCGRLVARFGARVPGAHGDWIFPSAARLAAADVDDVARIGIPRSRAATIVGLAGALVSGAVDLAPGTAPDAAVRALCALRGIGPWTARYLAMRALRDPDVFLSGDLVARRALGGVSPREAEERAAAWRPWRSYALAYLWMGQAKAGR